jgi:hypothetical protein
LELPQNLTDGAKQGFFALMLREMAFMPRKR